MIAYYDAENNTGNGHSDTATTWKDLSGNDNDGIIGNYYSGAWKDKYLLCDNNIYVDTNQYIDYDFTVEVIYKVNEMDSWHMLVSNAGTAITGGFNFGITGDNTVGLEAKMNEIWQNIKTNTSEDISNITSAYGQISSEKMITVGKNGEIDARYDTTEPWTNESGNAVRIGADGNDVNSRKFYGHIYAVRIYNRILSDDEIKANYVIDKYRFDITE